MVEALIRLYRAVISPLLGSRCRYYPSCSSYALEAVRTFGAVRGSVLALWRVARCNPLSDGGIDRVCGQRVFVGRSQRAALADGAEAVAEPIGGKGSVRT